MSQYNFHSLKAYQELTDWCADDALLSRIETCIETQKRAFDPSLEHTFRPDSQAAAAVAEETLRSILRSGRDVHGIATDRHISNVIVFNSRVEASISNDQVLAQRKSVDKAVAEKVGQSFKARRALAVACSGHFWYPPGAYMGWHTNSGAPGWRMYLTHAEEPYKSFFRYRDPSTQEIITSWDAHWNVRLFEVRSDKPVWHAIYSETNRFSLGYVIYPWSIAAWVGSKFRRRSIR